MEAEAFAGVEVEPERLISRDFLLACLGRAAFFSSTSLLMAVIPLYVLSIGGSESLTGLVVGMFSVPVVILSVFAGRYGDERGRKGMMLLGSAVLLPAALLYNLAVSIPLLIGLRLFHGTSLASFSSTGISLAADITPSHRRGEAIGWFGTSSNLSQSISPALGMFVYQIYGFWAVFFASAVMGGLAFLLTLLIKEPTRLKHRPQGTRGKLFSRGALLPATVACCLTVTWGTAIAFVPLFASANRIGNFGFFFSAVTAAMVLSRLVAGPASDRFGRTSVALPGLVLAAVALVLLSASTSLAMLLVSGILLGLSLGSVIPVLMALAIDRVKPEDRGSSMGTFGTALELGSGLGAMLFGLVLEASNFRTMFIFAGMVPLLGVVAFGWQYLRARRS